MYSQSFCIHQLRYSPLPDKPLLPTLPLLSKALTAALPPTNAPPAITPLAAAFARCSGVSPFFNTFLNWSAPVALSKNLSEALKPLFTLLTTLLTTFVFFFLVGVIFVRFKGRVFFFNGGCGGLGGIAILCVRLNRNA